MNRRTLILTLSVVALVFLQACGGAPTSQPGATKAVPTVQPTSTPKPTAAPPATSTPKPTAVPAATSTPKPTATLPATKTPIPEAPAYTEIKAKIKTGGMTDAQVNAYLAGLKGKRVVNWSGNVCDVSEMLGSYTIQISVDLTNDDLFCSSEITWGLTKDDALKYTKGQTVKFSGTIDSINTLFGSFSMSLKDVTVQGPGSDTGAGLKVQTIGTLYVSAGGEGVYIRSQPDREARVKVWPDGTAMGLIEKAPSGWAKVQAPDGYVGYIPLEYLSDKIPPTPAPAPTQPPAPPPSASTVGGPPVTVNGWTWSVYDVKKEKAVYFYKESGTAEGMFYILFLRVANGRSGTSYPEKDLDFYLIDASGNRYTTSRFESYAQWQYGGKGDSFDEFQPGQTGEIILLYDVPTGATGLRLVGTRDGQGAISIP